MSQIYKWGRDLSQKWRIIQNHAILKCQKTHKNRVTYDIGESYLSLVKAPRECMIRFTKLYLLFMHVGTYISMRNNGKMYLKISQADDAKSNRPKKCKIYVQKY